jgi:hypothetical protein
VRFVVPAAVAALLIAPASASAAPVLSVELTRDSVRYGAEHRVTGTLLDGVAALPGQEIVLEGRRYPYEGSYRVIERATTDGEGKFELEPELDRNHRLRVTAPAVGQTSPLLRAYVLPEFRLSFRALRPGVVRLYQRYTVPRSVRLKAPTLFYLGPRKAKRASRRVSADVERTRAGRYLSKVDFRVPDSWDGEFRYASCFRASSGSGMGDPDQSCPRLKLRF